MFTSLFTPHLYALFGFLLVSFLASWQFADKGRRRPIVVALILAFVHVLVLFQGEEAGKPLVGEWRFVAEFSALAAWIIAGAHVAFDMVLFRLGILKSVIIRDLAVALFILVACAMAASRAGFALSGVIATSAVFTAVIGLSLQDTLGNVIGGVSLQLDHSLTVGDWIKIGDLKGQVTQIGWRCATLEVNEWETVLIPNALLMRGAVTIQRRRRGPGHQWRRFIKFHVSLAVPPTRIITCVNQALANARIPHVVIDPPPSCICTDIERGCGSYTMRYWLDDPNFDDSTDSKVRSAIIASLGREGIFLSTTTQGLAVHPAQTLAFHEADERLELVRHLDLFTALNPEEMTSVAASLAEWPVAQGELLIREGDPGDCLFLIASGKFAVEIEGLTESRISVATLTRGGVVGETSLLTGAPRTATVLALADSLCYRLDRTVFAALTSARPELLEHLSALISQRQEGNADAQRSAHSAQSGRETIGQSSGLLQRMRDWLGRGEGVATGRQTRHRVP